MTPRPFWSCRRPKVGDVPYLIAVTWASGPYEAREKLNPGACVLPAELVSADVLAAIPADRVPNEVYMLEVSSLPSWRDNHGDRLRSRAYCEGIGYDPT